MAKRLNTLVVTRTERLSPHFVRLYLGGGGFDDFTPAVGADGAQDTDMYVKLIFGVPGVSYPEPFDLEAIRESFPPQQHPVLRTYTIRTIDPVARELVIDFVVHGDEGIAGAWAARVQPGEVVRFLGPGSGYRPRADAPWHLLACDESGLPAVAAALEALPDDATAQVFIEVATEADQLDLTAPAGATITWLHRGAGAGEVSDDLAGANAPLVAAVKAAPWLDGEPHVFIHGEAGAVMQNLRGYIRKERGVSAANASISGYWRRGRTEEGFREWKASQRVAEQQGSGQPAARGAVGKVKGVLERLRN
ncbi:siderophore-interacting protein [Gordonia sp. (in: high G+C Gram-positive bacteria)]|jgi:NADPH-dependent ferric siderophore reductase|uniref:siderophore-interacting protein n=1 Tax=Gordonia sp. (in: high G+C Gram-positive bacteria) TaxID=84139 RepID=UPI001D379DC2|nr:siderophore-interacting protein [Gordonia sp. (in: high G+C Gram-positive bacteria)]MCB1295027.1 siderophore-interacting protein [Gordonia sp. (in: high G+C Gram-positive bacteria)]HMS76875.1 siderophore-interacting protein [Gordonia sp. (in: high G+C Gram-positive bacteria)]